MGYKQLKKQLQAVLMTAGAEKLQSETRYNFTLEDGQSKIVPFYWCKKDTDGEDNTDFDLSTNYPGSEILWKSRCSGGYMAMQVVNEDAKGALLGLTWLKLNKNNFDLFDSAVDMGTKLDIGKSAVISEIVQDTLKNDDISRQFVPHIRYKALGPRQNNFEEGVLPTGKRTAPCETPFIKALMISNLSKQTSSSVQFQIIQNFYQYAPGVSTSTRSKVLSSTEA
jgi:hypothetical protein